MHGTTPGSSSFIRKTAMIALIALSAWGSLLLAESTAMAIGSMILHLTGIVLVGCVNLPEDNQPTVERAGQETRKSWLFEPERQLAQH